MPCQIYPLDSLVKYAICGPLINYSETIRNKWIKAQLECAENTVWPFRWKYRLKSRPSSLVLTATLSCMHADLKYTDLGLRQCFFVAVFQSHMGSLNLLGRLYKSVVHALEQYIIHDSQTVHQVTCCLLRLAPCMHAWWWSICLNC